MKTVQTVTGPVASGELGTTLMHEHLMIGWPGWEAEAPADRAARREHAKRCVDRMLELRDLGLATFLDPCPIDLGRDVELMAEVAHATGVHIVCATGLYKEDQGAPAYFKFRAQFGDGLKEMTDVFIRELTEGIGETGIRAGVIKVATSAHRITPYEEMVLRAAARAHLETGVPITTHTDEGTMGVEQLEILVGQGVAPQAIVVDVLPVQSSNAVGITKVRRERLAPAENGDLLRAKIAQAGGHPLDQRLPQHVEQAQRPAGKALSLTAVDNENGPYIHASHLGTAARNRLEREGTQDGTRRKREIGCKTRAR